MVANGRPRRHEESTTMLKISFLAILIAVIVNFALGGIWYQFLFRTPVRREFTAKYSKRDFVIDIARSLVMVWALAVIMARGGVNSWPDAMKLATLLWFGFMATAQLSEKLFGGRSWTFYLINTGYMFASLLVATTIFSFWAGMPWS
jgi:hypothetical protein